MEYFVNKLGSALILMLLSLNIFACDPKTACEECKCKKEEKPLWTRSASLGFNKTSGNSEVFGYNAGLSLDKDEDKNIFIFDAKTFYGKQEDQETKVKGTTVNKSIGLVQYNRLITDRLYYGLGVNFLRDEVADLKYRVTPVPVLGYYFLKSESLKLSAEAGPALVMEKVKSDKNEYFSPYIGQRVSYDLSKNSSFFQTAKLFLDSENSDNYLALAEIGIKADLIDNLSLILSLQDTYDNEPSAGKEKNDFIVVNSVGFSF